jgi:hypothetical protein
MKLTYEEVDRRKLRDAISRKENTVIRVTPRHANAVDALVELVTEIKSWPESRPSMVQKWIALQKAFFLSVRSLLFHAQLVELLPALWSSETEARRAYESDGSLVLKIIRRP